MKTMNASIFYYTILGAGLLSTATLTSCQEEVIGGENHASADLHTYTTTALISGYVNDEPGSRANVESDGKTFMWNTNDKLTLWDKKTAPAEFSISPDYQEAPPSAMVSFTGQADFEEGTTVWAVYPAVLSLTGLSFSLSDSFEQSEDGTPHLQQTMHMLAKGTATGSEISELNFEHLTSLFQFDVTNVRPENIKLKSVAVTSEPAVFSKKLSVADDGKKTYAEPVATLAMTLPDATLPELENEKSFSGYMNFFPTTGLTPETKLTFVVTYTSGDNSVEHKEILEGTVAELYGDKLSADEGQYVAGKRYKVSIETVLSDEERGYVLEDGVYIVNSADGLRNLILYEGEKISTPEMKIRLKENATFDMNGISWTPISEFKGEFDGNGATLENLTIPVTAGSMAGFVGTNAGTIKNLNLKNVTCNPNNSGMQLGKEEFGNGIICGINKALISNCSIDGVTLTMGNGMFGKDGGCIGMLVGINEESGQIIDTYVLGTSVMQIKADKSKVFNIGGLVGYSNGIIKGSGVRGLTIDEFTSIDTKLGGLIGAVNKGEVRGCFANTTLRMNTQGSWTGGLLGQAWHNTNTSQFILEASYAAGNIEMENVNGVGSVAGLFGQCTGPMIKELTSCYTTVTFADKNYQRKGAVAGQFNNPQAVTVKNVYYVSGSLTGDGETNLTNVEQKDIVDFNDELLNAMNSGLTEYQFAKNTDSSTNDKEPFVIVKVKK